MNKKKLLADVILIAVLLLIALAAYLLLQGGKTEGAGVSVCVEGVEIARHSLWINGEYELNGGTNTLVVENGTACVVRANCPDALCIHQGKIRYTGQCITCLPNRLTVTVYGGDSEVELIL